MQPSNDWPWWVTALAALTAVSIGVPVVEWLRWLIQQTVYDTDDPPTEGGRT